MESIWSCYMAMERERELRWHYRVIDTAKDMLQEENQRLKTQVEEVESIIKKTLESVDKLQSDLYEAKAQKVKAEGR